MEILNLEYYTQKDLYSDGDIEEQMLKMAKEAGCKTMNGLGMMLFQGAAAFKLWTGKEMPIDHMKEVLNIRYDD